MARRKAKPEDFEGWFQSTWRPAMAWQYLIVCLFDFLLAPVMNALYSEWADRAFVPWDPLTIRGGGLYHIAMAAVVGVTAWTRGSENMELIKMGFPRRRQWYAEDRGEPESEGPTDVGSEPTEESKKE
jgi:hypothetical protein